MKRNQQKCPVCRALLPKTRVYCGMCGTTINEQPLTQEDMVAKLEYQLHWQKNPVDKKQDME